MKFINSSKNLSSKLIKLMDEYKSIAFGVAWASSNNDVFQKLLKNKRKIKHGVIGIHFYQTDPNAIKLLQHHKNVKFILQPNGTFHPKVYLFWNNENDWQAIIGSANLTNGALSDNTELCVLINDKDSKNYFELYNIILSYEGIKMTDESLERYEKLWNNKKASLTKINTYIGKTSTLLDSLILSSTWDDYYALIQKDEHHGFIMRLDLLDEVRALFTSKNHFHQLDEQSRRIIAGIRVKNSNNNKWFGSMVGAGIFNNKIIENEPNISKALDCIPLSGEVTRADYLNFITEFKKAFPEGKDGPAITSRLLAMKRPDYFICINEPNLNFITNDLGITKSKIKTGDLRYEFYWDLIIQPILLSPWWNSPIPSDDIEKSAWHKRVAMLDVITYLA